MCDWEIKSCMYFHPYTISVWLWIQVWIQVCVPANTPWNFLPLIVTVFEILWQYYWMVLVWDRSWFVFLRHVFLEMETCLVCLSLYSCTIHSPGNLADTLPLVWFLLLLCFLLLLFSHGVCSEENLAEKMFAEMKEKNGCTYSAMIIGLVKVWLQLVFGLCVLVWTLMLVNYFLCPSV